VTRDDVTPSRTQRLMNASWLLFRAFGVDVRANWTLVLVPFLLFGLFLEGGFGAEAAAIWAIPWTVALYLTVWTHEMAHISIGRRFGMPARSVSLSIAGGLVHPGSPSHSPAAETLTALAGPVTQSLWVIALGVPYLLFDIGNLASLHTSRLHWAEAYQWLAAWQVALVAFNVMPCWPMDGGRVLRGFLSVRMTAQRASLWTAHLGYGLSMVVAILGLGLLFAVQGRGLAAPIFGSLALCIGVANFLACRQLETAAKHAIVPAERVESWKPGRGEDAWKDSVAESERLSRAEERRERRAAEARREEEAQRRKIQERIDQLLDRINEVGGIENLPEAERRELAEASEMLRRETVER
jgi:Zn-dependent protease